MFSVVLDKIINEKQGEIPGCMMFAKVIEKYRTEVNQRFDERRLTFERKGLRMSKSKTDQVYRLQSMHLMEENK